MKTILTIACLSLSPIVFCQNTEVQVEKKPASTNTNENQANTPATKKIERPVPELKRVPVVEGRKREKVEGVNESN